MNLRTLDLNLLVILEALLRERSVSRAAAAVGLTQPATSNALSRLRDALGDPLFTRTRLGMTPTPRALALQGPLADALARMRNALERPAPFSPQTSRRTFVIAASDHAQLLLFPELARTLERSPGLRLRVIPLPRDFPTEELETGELDLVIGIFDVARGDRVPTGLKRKLVVEEGYVAVARKDHPLFKGALTLERATSFPRLHVAPRGTGGVEERSRKAEIGHQGVNVFTPHYLVAPWTLAATDMVAALPERLARKFVQSFPLRIAPLPVASSKLRVHQVWHPRAQQDEGHQWLRSEVLRCARAEPGDADSPLGRPKPLSR